MSIRSMPCAALGPVLLLAAMLAGCNDPSLQRGTPPSIEISQSRAVVPLYRLGAARTLRSAIAALAPDGGIGRLDASIETLNSAHADATRAVLTQMGFDPSHIQSHDFAGDVVVLTRNVASVGSCNGAMQPPGLHGVDDSITSLGECVQATNLAAMTDHPRDLVAPVPLDPADGAVAARAIERWRVGDVKPPPRNNMSANGDQGDGGEVGGGTSPDAAQPAPMAQSAAGLSNPLLSPAPLIGGR